MLVFRINFPMGVTRGSLGVVQPFTSLAGACTSMERNLYILKGRL